ncbi:MAG TPA: PaaI family thioesterase [Solirubrobacteraceae bacterium]
MADPQPSRDSPPPEARRQRSGPWREPVRGGHPAPGTLTLSGTEQLQAMVSGQTPQPPLSRLIGMTLEEFGPGAATFRMPLSGWLVGPYEQIPLGPLTIPADAAMACAVMTGLPARTPFTTSELSLRLLRKPRPGGWVLARGRVVDVGDPVALAEVEVRDDRDQLIAHGSSLCVTLPAGAPRMAPPGAPEVFEGDGPDPWERAAAGTALDRSTWAHAGGLEIVTARLRGEVPPSPIEVLTGLAPAAASPGEAVFTLPASPWFCAPPPGRVQGGVVALLADAAIAGALETTAPPGVGFGPVDLKVNYLRPLASDGREACAQASSVHSGRRIGVAGAEVLDADRRPIAVATGSGLFTGVPG